MSDNSENKIYIHPEYDECGRPYYNVPNARTEENLVAVCVKYASKVIPVIFLPGVMGSNLKSRRDDDPVWLVNSKLGVASWIMKNASYRKETLDPQNTDIYDSGAINNYIAEGRKFSDRYHVMGYNWLQSNAVSARKLAEYVDKVLASYGKRCAIKKVILVTHSMGGLVARHYSENLGGRDNILGIVHGVMPDTGSPVTYKRMKTGEDGITGLVIGSNGAEMTPVLAQSPGPLQLLPGKAYGKGWLHIADGKITHKLPEFDPYKEIYLEKNRWWGLCETRFLNPDKEDKWKDEESWSNYWQLMKKTVRPFIEELSGKYHPNTYTFYGASEKHLSYGVISWKEVSKDYYNKTEDYSGMTFDQPVYDPYDLETGTTRMVQFSVGPSFQDIAAKTFKLAPPKEKGDGTVPEQAGRIPTRKLRSQLAVDADHEGAYDEDKARLFTLRSIVKMVQAVKIE